MNQWLMENVDPAGLFTFGVIIAIFAVLAIMVDMAKRKLSDEPAREPSPSEAPLSMRSRTARYELWRKELAAWTDHDGTQAGLNALLDRWYGISHEKPENKVQALAWDLEDVGLIAKEEPKPEGEIIHDVTIPDPLQKKTGPTQYARCEMYSKKGGGITVVRNGMELSWPESSIVRVAILGEVAKPKSPSFYNAVDDCYCGCPPALDIPGCKCPCHPREIPWTKNVFEIASKISKEAKASHDAAIAGVNEDPTAWSYTRKDGVVFRKGQWVRITGDRGLAVGFERMLFQVDRPLAPYGLMVRGLDGLVAVSDHEIEHAVPHTGEWWISAETGGARAYRVGSHHDRGWLDRMALKGEIVPVNFGRGLESPRFKAGQWVRVVRGPHTGKLAMIFSAWERTCDAAMEPGVGCNGPAFRYEEIEPAAPLKGEWWRKIRTCHFGTPDATPFEIGSSGPCPRCTYEPVNFGRGEEAKG